jgi:hypothetical protein
MFPDAKNFDITGSSFNEAQNIIYNITVIQGNSNAVQANEPDDLLDQKKWEALIAKANTLIAQNNGVKIPSNRSVEICSSQLPQPVCIILDNRVVLSAMPSPRQRHLKKRQRRIKTNQSLCRITLLSRRSLRYTRGSITH